MTTLSADESSSTPRSDGRLAPHRDRVRRSRGLLVAPPSRSASASGARTSAGKLDFVAQTATGGAFVTHLGDNFVTIVFGESPTDGKQIELAYQRFAFANVRAGLADVLKRYNNVVTLWHAHPSDTDLAIVTGCLK